MISNELNAAELNAAEPNTGVNQPEAEEQQNARTANENVERNR